MINPNICKYITVSVPSDLIQGKTDFKDNNAFYKGVGLKVMLRDKQTLKAGNRKLYLKYSIMSDCYWLSDRI